MMRPSTFFFLTRRGVRNLGKHWAMTIACIASLSVCMTHKDHVPGGGDGQPLGNALHDTHQDRFDDLEKRNKSLLQHPLGA